MLCGRATFDPDLKERQWARAVSGGVQVLICPSCQVERQGWDAELERCVRCGSTRLSGMLSEVVCRAGGLIGATAPAGRHGSSGA